MFVCGVHHVGCHTDDGVGHLRLTPVVAAPAVTNSSGSTRRCVCMQCPCCSCFWARRRCSCPLPQEAVAVAGGLSHPVHPRPSPCGRWLVDQVDHMWWRGVQLVWARCSPQFCTQFCWMPVGRWVCHVRRAGSWQLGRPPCWWESASQPARLHRLWTHAGHHTAQHHNVCCLPT